MAYNPETMSFEVGDNDVDMVFVSGLPLDATEADIAAHFGSIGVVKFDKKQNKHKIWMYRDKMTGAPKGECTVTYEGASAVVTCPSGGTLLRCSSKFRVPRTRQLVRLATALGADPFTASSAVSWFSGKEFKGATLKVTLADKKPR